MSSSTNEMQRRTLEWIDTLVYEEKRNYALRCLNARSAGDPLPKASGFEDRDWPAKVRSKIDRLYPEPSTNLEDSKRTKAKSTTLKPNKSQKSDDAERESSGTDAPKRQEKETHREITEPKISVGSFQEEERKTLQPNLHTDPIFSDDELIEHLSRAVDLFGVNLTPNRYNQMYASKPGTPRSIVIVKRFGSWESAFEFLLSPQEAAKSSDRDWSEFEIMIALKAWIREKRMRYGLTQKAYRHDASRDRELPPLELVFEKISPIWSDVIDLVMNWSNPKASFDEHLDKRPIAETPGRRKTNPTLHTIDDAESRLERLLETEIDL
jgi:hypothetical protein